MNQHFLSNFSIVVIKYFEKEDLFIVSNRSFIRNSVFLTCKLDQKYFQNSLFYVQLEGNNRDFKVPIQFGQRILLRHKMSNRYLGYSQVMEEEEDVNSTKMGYVSTRADEEDTEQRKALVGLNFKSKLTIQSYYQCQKQESNYTFGSIIWLNHLESQTLLRSNRNGAKYDVVFDGVEFDKDRQDIRGLWLIESDQLEQGGRIKFEQKLRLKNLASGKYLSFSKNFKFNENQRVYNIIFEERPTDQSKFYFRSLKGDDNYIKKGSYLKFQHCQSKLYVGCRKSGTYQNEVNKPLAFPEFEDEDLFKIIQLNQNEQQAIRFIFSIREQLQNIQTALQNRQLEWHRLQAILQIYDNINRELQKLAGYGRLFEKIQTELKGEIKPLSQSLNQFRIRIVHLHQHKIQYTETIKKQDKDSRKYNRQFCDIYVKMISRVYQILRLLCKNNSDGQNQCYKYLQYFVKDIFMNVGAQQLLKEVFCDNYRILCKVPHLISQNENIVKASLNKVLQVLKSQIQGNTEKDIRYWREIRKIITLLKALITNNDKTIDINQRLISEELFERQIFKQVFFDLKITDQRIKIGTSNKNGRINYENLQKIQEIGLLKTVQQIFLLLSLLCANRNFVSKNYVNRLLNQGRQKDAAEVLIAYLNLQLPGKLKNNIYSLITNLFIDSSPRIDRYKPLKIVNFSLEVSNMNRSSVQHQQAQLSGRLKQNLLIKAEQAYVSRPLNISNLIQLIQNIEPSLSSEVLRQYKAEINGKIEASIISPQILNSVLILLKLQVYEIDGVIDIFNLLSIQLGNKIPEDVMIGVMLIFDQIGLMVQEIELRKLSAFLKYKYRTILNKTFNASSELKYVLPGSPSLVQLLINKDNRKQTDLTQPIGKYNDTICILQGLMPSKQTIQYILELFSQSKPNRPRQYLQTLFKVLIRFCKPKQTYLKTLMDSILITSEQVQMFDSLFELYKKLQHLISFSQFWLCKDSDPQKLHSFFYTLGEVIKALHEGYEPKVSKMQDVFSRTQYSFHQIFDKLATVKVNSLSIGRQLLVKNIGFQLIVLELLQTNYYLLQVEEKKKTQKRFVLTFTLCFEFLYGLIHSCPQNKKMLSKHWHVLNKFRSLVEVGQTKLFNQILSCQKQYVKEVQSKHIEQVIFKIINSPKEKTNQRCEFNPQYLTFIHSMIVVGQKVYKPNLQKLYRLIDKTNILRKMFFIDFQKNGQLCLDIYKVKTDPSNLINVPYFYHIKFFKLINLIIENLDSQNSIVRIKLLQILPIGYLFSFLCQNDIYNSIGTMPEMIFLLKRQTLKIVRFYLDKTDILSKYYNSITSQSHPLKRLVQFYQGILIKKVQKLPYTIDNQKLYLPFLKQYKKELLFYENNLRTHYRQDIRPLLQKLLTILSNTGRDQKMGRQIQQLLQRVDNQLQRLTQNLEYLQKGKIIDKVKFKWRNFVDQQHSQQQKYAKSMILKVLKSDQTVKQLSQQKVRFHRLLMSRVGQTSRGIVQLLELSMQMQLAENDNQQCFDQIISVLQLLIQMLNDENQKSSQLVQALTRQNIIEILINFVTKPKFDYHKHSHRKIFSKTLTILNFLVSQDDDAKNVKLLYKIFNQNKQSHRFFMNLKQSINGISERLDGTESYEHINNTLNQLYFSVEQQNYNIDQEALEFICNVCNYIPFTTLLRQQSLYSSIDFLQKTYNSLIFVLYQQSQSLHISVATVDAAEDLLEALTAMLRGGNQSNQNFIIDNKFPEIIHEVLKIHEMKPFRTKTQVAETDKLLQEVIEFYETNGVMIRVQLQQKMALIDFTHDYVLNRLKYTLLKTLLECLAGNEKGYSKIKIQIPIQVLKINLIWVYNDMINGGHQYTQQNIIRPKLPWQQILAQNPQQLNPMFLFIGFYYYTLIQNITRDQDDNNEDQDNFSDDKEHTKKKLVMKFFKSIAQKQKKLEKLQKLQNQPFALEIRQFYEKYYEAIEFFGSKTLTIQVNLNNSLTRVFFPKLPFCQKVSKQMQNKFKTQCSRISQQEKIKSLIEFQNQTFQLLKGERDFFEAVSRKLGFVGVILSALNENILILLALVFSVFISLFYILDDFQHSPEVSRFLFTTEMFVSLDGQFKYLILVLQILNLFIAVLLLVYLFSKKVPITYSLLSQIEQERTKQAREGAGLQQYRWMFITKGILSQIFYSFFIVLMLILSFVHPMFAGFILLQTMNRINIGKQILRSIKQTWFQLLAATILLLFFNFTYSLYVYVKWTTFYGPTCEKLGQCLLFLVDQSLKSDSGFLGSVPFTYQNNVFNLQFFSEMLYILFAQKVIFQIFSGTIIDKFSQIRQQNQDMQEDQNSNCFICGQQRFSLDFELQGFEKHVQINHNPMNYIYYLFYIRLKSKKQHGIVEKYVSQCQNRKKKDWIPNNTSISKIQHQRGQQKVEQQDNDKKYQQYFEKKIKQLRGIKARSQNTLSEIKMSFK